MSSPAISSLVAGIKISLTHWSGNAILKIDSPVVSEIPGQLCNLHTPLVLRNFTSSLLVQMVGVTHCLMVWVAGDLGLSVLGGLAHFRRPPSIPCWRSSAIYYDSPLLTFRSNIRDPTHIAPWFCSHSGVLRSSHNFPHKTISNLRRGLVEWAFFNLLKLPTAKCGRRLPLSKFQGSWNFVGTDDPSDLTWWVPPSPQARPPKPDWSCGCSDISHGCVGGGGRILIG